MKKKVLAGILAATMAFSMAACGSTGSSSDSGSSAASGSTAKTEEKGEPYTVTMVLQGSQQQDQAVDAGRDGQRQHQVANLPHKTERRNAGKFKYQFHLCFPLLSGSAPTTALRKTRRLIVIFFCFSGLHRQPGSHFFMLHKYSRLPHRGQGQFLTCLTNMHVFFCIL